jgi:hypothetical protein
MPKTKDEKLLETETPDQQVDRMGNAWQSVGQYEKQLGLPVHLIATDADDDPVLVQIERDGNKVMGYRTVCGLALGGEGSTTRGKHRGEGTLRSTDDRDDATCQACLE